MLALLALTGIVVLISGWVNARAIVGGWDAWLAAELRTRAKPAERV